MIEMIKKSTMKRFGQEYKLPDGYYAVEDRFGEQIYDANGANVTQKVMGAAKSNDLIISTENGILHLEKAVSGN